jgi:hypothetical protein
MSFDTVIDDSKKVAHKGITVLVGLGGVVAGIGLAMSDIGLDLVDKLMELVSIESDLIANALILLIGIIVLVVVLSLRTMVSSTILVQLFTFLAVMCATYLVIKVIALVIGFFKGDVAIDTTVGG